MTDCAVIVPMLGRPWTVEPLARSLAQSKAPARLVFIVGTDDNATWAACRDYETIETTRRIRGDYAAKINLGIRSTLEPWVFLGACDIQFHAGWWESCMKAAETGAQVIGTNDLANPRTANGDLSTHTLLSRDYANLPTIDGQPGPLCEQYLHEYTDNELVGTAKKRGAYAHAPDAIVEHLHPSVGRAPWDDSYRKQAARMSKDRMLFRRRRKLWT